MSFIAPLIPDNAPFTPAQRAWINGWLAGYLAMDAAALTATPPPPAAAADEFPWHDATLPLDERLRLAAGQPKERRLMAAMAQLDSGNAAISAALTPRRSPAAPSAASRAACRAARRRRAR